jgi:hypothetical protein
MRFHPRAIPEGRGPAERRRKKSEPAVSKSGEARPNTESEPGEEWLGILTDYLEDE